MNGEIRRPRQNEIYEAARRVSFDEENARALAKTTFRLTDLEVGDNICGGLILFRDMPTDGGRGILFQREVLELYSSYGFQVC